MKNKSAKRMITILVCVAMLFSLASCGSQAATSTTSAAATTAATTKASSAGTQTGATKANADIKIGVLIFNFANDYISYVRAGIEDKAKTLGIKVEVVDGGGDQTKQLEQLDTLISKGVDAISISPIDTASCQTIVDKCKAAGIPLMLNNKKPAQAVIDSYVNCWYAGCATQQPGEEQAKLIAEDWKSGAIKDKNGDGIMQYIYVYGQFGMQNSIDREAGVNLIFDQQGIKRKELEKQEAGWATAKAKDLMDAWIMKYGDNVECVISQNDAMAIGCMESMSAAGKKYPIYGINCLAIALPYLKSGALSGTVLTDEIKEGHACIQILYNHLTKAKDLYANLDPGVMVKNKVATVDGAMVRLANVSIADDMYKIVNAMKK